MKLALFLVLSQLLMQTAEAQDRLVLLSGDTLKGQVDQVSPQMVVLEQGGKKGEIPSVLISQLFLKSGKRTIFHPIPQSLDFGMNFRVLEYSQGLVRHIELLFPSAVKHSYRFSNSSAAILPVAPYQKATQATGQPRDKDLSEFTTFGYACNAFLAVVDSGPGWMTFTFFSNPVQEDKIKKSIVHRFYKLKDFQTVGSTTGLADGTFTMFTMKFLDSTRCEFFQDGKLSQLEYVISQDGSILFRGAQKRKGGTTYQVVFIDGQTMRYTHFSSFNNNLVTRKVEAIDEKEVIAK